MFFTLAHSGCERCPAQEGRQWEPQEAPSLSIQHPGFLNLIFHHRFPNSPWPCIDASSVQLTSPHLFLTVSLLATPTFPSSKYVAIFPDGSERRKPPPLLPLAPPPSSGFKSKCRCLTCTLQTVGGRGENPHCKLGPPLSQQGPQGSQHRRGTDQGLFLFHVCTIFS